MSFSMEEVYFAWAIRGGTDDMAIYSSLINHIKKYAKVLTEHIWDDVLLKQQRARLTKDEDIYKEDIKLIDQADIIIAEVTQVSLGVGYELGYAESKWKKVHCFFNTNTERKLSAMIRWNAYFTVHDYKTLEEAYLRLDTILRIEK